MCICCCDVLPIWRWRTWRGRSRGDLRLGFTGAWIHETFPELGGFQWQRGYGGFTVSHSVVPDAERYIRNQQEHHKDTTFTREFEGFLQRHGIEHDPRYVFE